MAESTVFLDIFNPENETIAAYQRTLSNLIFLSRRMALLMPRMFQCFWIRLVERHVLLRNLVSPELPKDKSFDKLTRELKNQENGHRGTFQFLLLWATTRQQQQSGENIAMYVAELRRLSNDCAFNDHLTEALHDKFVCGLCSEATLQCLLAE